MDKFQKLAVAVGAFGLAKKIFFSSTGGKPNSTSPDVQFGGQDDYRARLVVPADYVSGELTRGVAGGTRGSNAIIFPYTPSISYDSVATYSTQNVMHSNFAFHSYKNSSVGSIKLNAKFTVQNDSDAMIYLATAHLLKSLTKMHYGADDMAGAPPPVCRFSAYGTYMIKNVPVVVSSFSHDLPSDIDYYMTDSKNNAAWEYYGTNFVPTVSTFNITLLPMYSRNEQSSFSVQGFRDTPTLRKGGFL
jgi:hypothetical protein